MRLYRLSSCHSWLSLVGFWVRCERLELMAKRFKHKPDIASKVIRFRDGLKTLHMVKETILEVRSLNALRLALEKKRVKVGMALEKNLLKDLKHIVNAIATDQTDPSGQ